MTRKGVFVLSWIGLAAGICPADSEHSVRLVWQAQACSESLYARLDERPFAGEPDLPGHKVLRGFLTVGEDRSERLGILWDTTQARLYLDLNRDGDLANDPNNTWDRTEASKGSSRLVWQRFNGVRVALGPDPNASAVFDVVFNDYGSFRQASFTLRSAYVGTVDLHGQVWIITFVDTNLDGRIDGSDRFRVPNTSRSVTIPHEVFVGGSNYELALDAFPRVTFTHMEVPMGTLEIKAKAVQTLLLNGPSRLVWLDPSVESTRVPADEYTCVAADLTVRPGQMVQPTDLAKLRVTVPENGMGRITVGGPLRHCVEITRSGNALRLAYQLRGAGGEMYDVRTVLPSSRPPTFRAYRGDTVVGSGAFEFG